MRGGIICLEHPGWVDAKIETVLNLQAPLSEGIVDQKYSLVAVQLIRFAVKRSPYVYIVGMGNEQNALPKTAESRRLDGPARAFLLPDAASESMSEAASPAPKIAS